MGRNKYTHDWTEEEEITLARCWKEGLPVARIKNLLGAGITRNSIIAKAHKLNLGEHPNAPAHHPKSREDAKKRERDRSAKRREAALNWVAGAAARGMDDTRVPRLHHIGFETRRLPGEPVSLMVRW